MFHLCLTKIPICMRRWELCFFTVFSADAHFSCDTPFHSVFDIAFAHCPLVGESGATAPNRRSSVFCKKPPPQVNCPGPCVVGLAVPRLERLALAMGLLVCEGWS